MSQRNDLPRLPLAWTRFDYMNVTVPSAGSTGLALVRKPALLVRPRTPNSDPGLAGPDILADAVLDTGADAPAAPFWLFQELGIPIDEGTRRKMHSASGQFWAYAAQLGMEILCGRSWIDIGVANVLVPDTKWSRDPSARRPLLLGLDGFFDRVNMYINHSREEFWLELPVA